MNEVDAGRDRATPAQGGGNRTRTGEEEAGEEQARGKRGPDLLIN